MGGLAWTYDGNEIARLTLELVRRLAADAPNRPSGAEPTMAYCPPELRYRRGDA